jgi:predicted ABC-type sugar transport system permease subunit
MKRPALPSSSDVGVSPGQRVQSETAVALPQTPRRRRGRGWQQEFGLVIAILLLGIYFTSRNGVFVSFDNLGNIAEQSTFIGILAVGMTFVVVSGQFDLSGWPPVRASPPGRAWA